MPLFGAASGPPSPTYSAASTRASFDAAAAPAFAGPLITRSALRASLGAYEELLGAAKAYTAATLAMSAASAALAGALEGAARIKGAHAVGSELQAAAGLHHLLANSQSLVADVLWRDVSIPLLERFDAYRAATTERQLGYEADIRAMSQRLKATEERNLRTKRKKERDLASFKLALRELQEQVEALDEIKRQHYVEVREAEEEVWAEITGKVSHLLRTQLDLHERISSKGESDPVIEGMIATVPDPFSAYGAGASAGEGQMFSVLAPGSLGLLSPEPSTPALGLSRQGVTPSAHGLGIDEEAQQHGRAAPLLPMSASSGALFGSDESQDDIFNASSSSAVSASGSGSSSAAAAAASQQRDPAALSTTVSQRLKHALSIIDEHAARAARGATPEPHDEETASWAQTAEEVAQRRQSRHFDAELELEAEAAVQQLQMEREELLEEDRLEADAEADDSTEVRAEQETDTADTSVEEQQLADANKA